MLPLIQAVRKATAKERRARTDGAPAEKRAKKKAKRKAETRGATGRNEEAEESRKRPQSPSPAPSRSPTPLIREPRVDREAPIDLTDTPPEEPRAEIPPLPPPTAPEVESIASATRPTPEATPPTKRAMVEEPPQAAAPTEGPPSASDPVPADSAPARTEEEDEAEVPSFKSILERHDRWAE